RNRLPEPFDERLVSDEKERSVLPDPAAERSSELIAMESRLVEGVEVVFRVERVITVVLVERSVGLIAPGLREHVDLSARIPTKLRAVWVRLAPKLPDRLHAECRSRGAPGRTIREVVLERAI